MDSIKFSMSDVKLSSDHPNKMVIDGCICILDSPSDSPPCGSDKRVVLTKKVANKCIDSFAMMPLDCIYPEWGNYYNATEIFTGHGTINIGVIESTRVEGNKLMATMTVWKDTFPEIAFMILNGKDSLGFSFELYPKAAHEEMKDDEMCLFVDDFIGTGCAILWKECAAYNSTFIKQLAASMKKNKNKKDDVKMTEEEMLKITEKVTEQLKAQVGTAVSEAVAELKTSIETISASNKDLADTVASVKESMADVAMKSDVADFVKADALEEIKASVAEVKDDAVTKAEELEAIKASMSSAKPPIPKAGQSVVGNGDLGDLDVTAEIKKIEASATMTPMQKLKEITKLRASKKVEA